jgi:putative ABC transport system ATP-binding protein
MIKLINVSKTYYLGEEKVPAVQNVTLNIKAKEVVGILGSSGCGKSTLMYLIGLLETPSSGKILLDNKDVSRLSDRRLSAIRNNNIGFVFQQFNLLNKFTVLENILLPTRYAQSELKFNPQKRALTLLKKFSIYDRRHFFPNKISGGQQQRAAIARALVMNPKIVLADEPTGNVDSKTGKEILDILLSLNKDFGVTVVVVTHDRQIAQRTQRQIYMHDGQIIKTPQYETKKRP